MAQLLTTTYDKSYYEEHKDIGLDYLVHGFWQQSYCEMVTEITMQHAYDKPAVYDAGAACGTMLQGFRETGVYSTILGIDITEHMVNLGREHFGFSPEQLIAGSIEKVPVRDETFSLVHSHQVLEHIPPEITEQVLAEFVRILRPGGRAVFVLDAMRQGESKEMYMGDPTHVNIQPTSYWIRQFQSAGLGFDVETYDRLWRNERGPTAELPENFMQTYKFWTAFTLVKV